MMFGILALVTAALFAGAAFYVSFAEHPARCEIDDRAQLQQWKFAYRRGTLMQGTLAALGFLLGIAAWWQSRDELYIVGAIMMGANWAYTALMIMPVNNELKSIALDDAGEESHTLLRRWGKLHVKRTMLGIGASALFLWAVLSR
ncbi:DUF1772 domain-containing protein [Reyranella aquatilis]|jgi:hypothetical protein|uniref:DUF1772 domain-containing protein n=1 Tax=Reyranella aquatilis TaxID=2035356 RepID=A0ABS8KY05_9HYPH|nr:DUF1772 domain-containing protein [Reyranella aquatilis]MCC8430991.1 DUF1772 domain-containing protein [Reyranella aquatilis]